MCACIVLLGSLAVYTFLCPPIQKFIHYMDLLFHGGANAGAVVTSFLSIVFLIVMDYVNMFIKKKFPRFPFPIPSQIILVMLL